MNAFHYSSTISDFFNKNKSEDEIVRILTENNDFSSTRRTTMDSTIK